MANIVFDLDGTLIDSAPDLHGCANRILQAEGHAPITLDEARSFIGNGASEFLRLMRLARGIPDSDHDFLLAQFMEDYAKAVHLTRIMPGAVRALSDLKAQGHRLGLCTNKPKVPCLAVLDHLELTQFFDVIIAGDSLPVRKPDPQPLIAAFAALGTGEDLYVGDSGVDAETARQALIPFVLYTGGYAHGAQLTAAARFDDFADLSATIDALFTEAE